jgi:UDP-N-acetylmuramoyl-tripeptide--D-alanyl-D-alanine ligase
MTGFSWTDLEVRRALDLRTDLAREGLSFSEISTDTRTIRPGALFVPLVGDRFDGHDFVADAVAGGARGVVVSRSLPAARDVPVYPVDDTLVALGALARHRREQLECPVVAITGSSGKTTTKDFLAAAVGGVRRTHATRGNLNNRVGVPLTLLATPDEAEVVVLELGTSEPGEIRALTEIARPDIAVLTTVGHSHLEKLGSLEGVLDEKLDLLRHLSPEGRAVVGDEPPVLVERAREIRPRVRVVGWSERADENARPRDPETDAFGKIRFRWHGHSVSVPLAGRHAVSNALLALTVADLLGVPASKAAQGLQGAQTAAMRGQVKTIGGLTVIVDCYNANPESVRAALRLLEGYGASAGRVAVLGSMLELGSASEQLHREVLADALAGDIDLVLATGAFGAAAQKDFPEESRVVAAPDWKVGYPLLRNRLAGEEVVLLKASRGIALEGILPLLEADFGADVGRGDER